jgi:hypothetical protein
MYVEIELNIRLGRSGEFHKITGTKIKNIKIDNQLDDRKVGVEGSKIENKLVIIFNY